MTVEELIFMLGEFPLDMKIGYHDSGQYFLVDSIDVVTGVHTGWDDDDNRVYEDVLVVS